MCIRDRHNDSIPFVYKTSNGKIVKQEVVIGPSNNNEIVVDYGLQEQDEIYLSVPENSKDFSFQYLDEATKKEIKEKQEEREKARLAKLEEQRKQIKEDVPVQGAGGGGGFIIFN